MFCKYPFQYIILHNYFLIYSMQFSNTKITKFIFCSILWLSFLFWYGFVAAKEQKVIYIDSNYQEFISFKKYPSLAQIYYSSDLSFETTHPHDISLIVKNNSLVFWKRHGSDITQSQLIIGVKWKQYSFPIHINIEKNERDFNIFPDMYELTLQKKSLSCESAAAADILETFFRKSIHEDSVISLLPKWSHYNTLPQEHPDGIKIWGNPELWFVWHIDHSSDITAKQKLMTWYWVYEAPISDVYQDYWFYTEIFNESKHNSVIWPDMHLRYLLEKLQNGSMVQLWWDWCTKIEYDDGILESKNDGNIGWYVSAKNTCYNVDDPRELKWKYYDRNWKLQEHIWLDGEHAFILLWWKGDIKNPTHIRVWDTDTGYHLYPKQEWMRKWEKMDYRSIIITKKDS